MRLKPEGIFVKNKIAVENWFLNGKNDVRSSYMLEDVVTEFDIQGLEPDYSVVAWDADFRYDGRRWTYNNFVGNKWITPAEISQFNFCPADKEILEKIIEGAK